MLGSYTHRDGAPKKIFRMHRHCERSAAKSCPSQGFLTSPKGDLHGLLDMASSPSE